MSGVPDEVRAVVDGLPAVGERDQAFVLTTVDPDGVIDVCLLSRTEVATTSDVVRVVVGSRKARRNLQATGRATLLVVANDAAHYLALALGRTLEEDGAMAAELGVVRSLRDDLGVELLPMRFRVDEKLRVLERWDRTASLLVRLAETGQPEGG